MISLNTFLIITLFYLIGFAIYVFNAYLSSKSKKFKKSKQIKKSGKWNIIMLGILIMLIFYIIILSYLIKIPSFKPYYVYECFPVKYIPLPLLNESRCSKIILFNLTFPLEANRVMHVKPEKLLNNKIITFNEPHGAYLKDTHLDNCILEPGTAFFYYCMEYDSRDPKLYFMNVKNDLESLRVVIRNDVENEL